MKTSQLILKTMIGLFIIMEVFALFSVINTAQIISNGGDIITFAQDLQIKGQYLTKGTYVITSDGFIKLENYWIYETKVFAIAIPLLMLFVSIFLLRKKKNLVTVNMKTKDFQDINEEGFKTVTIDDEQQKQIVKESNKNNVGGNPILKEDEVYISSDDPNKCPACGNKINPELVVCPDCGLALK